MRYIALFSFFISIVFSRELVIVSSSNSFLNKLNQKEVVEIYLGKIRRVKGHKIIPLNLKANNPLRREFEEKILKKDRKWLAMYWLKAHYHGHHPPKVFDSKKAIILFLKRFENAICYLDKKSAKKEGLKILYESSK